MAKILIILVLLVSPFAHASEILTVDRVITKDMQLFFPNERKLSPKLSDFKVLNYVLMSNELGERWAVITMKNLSHGNRSLEASQMMALLADGSRHAPLEYQLNFKGNQTQSITVGFGQHKFPVLSIYTNNDLP